MQIDLSGRVAAVTGGSLGLGLAMGRAFAEAGADVALIARREEVLKDAQEEIARSAKGRVEIVPCDVREAAAIEAAHAQIVGALGGIDIMVNNAGTSKTGPFLSHDDADWQHDLDLKLFAAIRFNRLVIPHMREQRWGRVINVLNIGAKAPGAQSTPTSVSRAAGLALTKAMSKEYAPDNVLVNALCTGILVSDQWLQRYKASGVNQSFEEWCAEKGQAVPLGRMGDAREYANMACFLASDAASYVTGVAINVDGGMSPVA